MPPKRIVVETRSSDGYVNADMLMESMGMGPESLRAFLDDPETKELMKNISEETGIPESQLIKVEPVRRPDEDDDKLKILLLELDLERVRCDIEREKTKQMALQLELAKLNVRR